MELISMVEFVKKMNNSESKGINALIVEYGKIVDYAKFLQTPLSLEMFVPVGENGNVISEKYDSRVDDPDKKFYELVNEYAEAKEKVLFEGLTFKFGMIGYNRNNGWSSCFDLDFRPNSTIEDLLKDKIKYTLTEAAIKKLGL